MSFVRTFKARKKFLDRLEVGDSESAAARAAGGELRSFRKWRREDPDFDRDWEDAVEAGTDFIEDVATERALLKSDPLMIMMLKARRPDKYDRHAGKASVEVNVNVEGSKQKLLNKVARLQAERNVPTTIDQAGPEISGDQSEQASVRGLLPPPSDTSDLRRGTKRQRIAERNS